LGYTYVDLAQAQEYSEVTTKEFDLQGNRADGQDSRTGTAQGKVKLTLRWCPFGDDECLRDAAESEDLQVAGSDWKDCHNGCHNAIVDKLTPIYKRARDLMANAVKAGKDEKKFDDMEDEFADKAEELDEWLEHHPIAEHMKVWRRPGRPPCPAGHGGEGQPPCPGPPPLTPEQQFALTWQAQKRARDDNEHQHEVFKKKEEEAKDKAKKAFSAGKDAMETIGDELVAGAKSGCGDLVVPFIQRAGEKITKIPEGKFKIEKGEQAVRQLDAVWSSVAEFKNCLFSKWKSGSLLPNRQVQTTDDECFQSISSGK